MNLIHPPTVFIYYVGLLTFEYVLYFSLIFFEWAYAYSCFYTDYSIFFVCCMFFQEKIHWALFLLLFIVWEYVWDINLWFLVSFIGFIIWYFITERSDSMCRSKDVMSVLFDYDLEYRSLTSQLWYCLFSNYNFIIFKKLRLFVFKQ